MVALAVSRVGGVRSARAVLRVSPVVSEDDLDEACAAALPAHAMTQLCPDICV